MLCYCLKCRKNTESKNPMVAKRKAPLSQIPLVGPFLF